MASIVERPIAESIEYRPPTQSQNPNMLAVSMPNFADFRSVRRDRHEMLRDRLFVAAEAASDQSRAVWALVIVSSVVKVFDETMNSVSAGSRSWVASSEVGAIDVGDEPERHRRVRCNA